MKRFTVVHSEMLRDNLTERPMTYDQMVELTGLSKVSVARWVKGRRAAGRVFIEGYGPDKNERLFCPLFRWGNLQDAARPGYSISPAERMRQHRAQIANDISKAFK